MLGKRVMLREGHVYYYSIINNPTNTIGVIINYHCNVLCNLPIQVRWSNGTTNIYKESDLIFIDGIDPIKYIKKHELV